jgi:hypothetical protein
LTYITYDLITGHGTRTLISSTKVLKKVVRREIIPDRGISEKCARERNETDLNRVLCCLESIIEFATKILTYSWPPCDTFRLSHTLGDMP